MGQALGSIVPLAAAVAIFPVPVIAVVLLLASERGRLKGLAFVAAWCVGLAGVGALVLAFAGAADAGAGGEPASWASLLLLGLGLLVLGLAAKQWRGRPRGGDEAATPGWMRSLGDFTVARSAGAGFALSALNPKNVLLTVAAGAEIAQSGLSASPALAVLAVYVLLASAGVLTPLVYVLVRGDRSRQPLDALRGWMARNNAVIMTVLFVLIGAKLIGDAIAGLSA
jgi:threonine/homoserine/homoserine lactone efflux protein